MQIATKVPATLDELFLAAQREIRPLVARAHNIDGGGASALEDHSRACTRANTRLAELSEIAHRLTEEPGSHMKADDDLNNAAGLAAAAAASATLARMMLEDPGTVPLYAGEGMVPTLYELSDAADRLISLILWPQWEDREAVVRAWREVNHA